MTSLALQYALGATLYASYYDDERDPIQNLLPCGQSVISALHSVMSETGVSITPKVFVHYPIESIMENASSSVDVARVYDSVLNEYLLPYPIDRSDLARSISPESIVEDTCYDAAKRTENAMESVMFSLLNDQIPFLFSDTASFDRVLKLAPALIVIPPQNPTEELLKKIPMLIKHGAMVTVMLNEDTIRDNYRMCEGVVFVESAGELHKLLDELSLIQSAGDTCGVVSMWTDDGILVVNSNNAYKQISYKMTANTAKEYVSGENLPLQSQNGWITLSIPPYGVAVIK